MMIDWPFLILGSLALFVSGLFSGLVLARHSPQPDRPRCPKCGFLAAWVHAEQSFTCLSLNCGHWFRAERFFAPKPKTPV
jgi:hypothetical protein